MREREARRQVERALEEEGMTAGKKDWFIKVRDNCETAVSRASANTGRRMKDKLWQKLLDEIEMRTTWRTKRPAEKATNAASAEQCSGC